MKFSLVLALVGASSTLAAPLPFFSDLVSSIIGDDNEAAPAPISADEISDFARIAQFARASFCTTPVVEQWACGEACDANPQTQPIIAGGDNEEIPRCKYDPHLGVFCSETQLIWSLAVFVAFDPPSNSIVVAHQGTNKRDFDSILNDIDIFFEEPSDADFPGAKDAGAQLHSGFQDT